MKKKVPSLHTFALTDLQSAAPSIDTIQQGPSIAITNKYRHFLHIHFPS